MFIWAALLKITMKQTSRATNMKDNLWIRYRRQTKQFLQSIPECLIWNSGFCHSKSEKCSCCCIDKTTKLTSAVIEGCCCRLNATTRTLAEHHVSCFKRCHSNRTVFNFGGNHRACDFIIMFTLPFSDVTNFGRNQLHLLLIRWTVFYHFVTFPTIRDTTLII